MSRPAMSQRSKMLAAIVCATIVSGAAVDQACAHGGGFGGGPSGGQFAHASSLGGLSKKMVSFGGLSKKMMSFGGRNVRLSSPFSKKK